MDINKITFKFIFQTILIIIFLWVILDFINDIFRNQIYPTKFNRKISYLNILYKQNDYPIFSPLSNILQKWNPDTTFGPENFKENLLHFNYENTSERRLAEYYRNLELPFKVYNVKELEKVSKKWDDEYLTKKFENHRYSVEESDSNHFLYWNQFNKQNKSYIPPTRQTYHLNFKKWLSLAKKADRYGIGHNQKHYYLMSRSNKYESNSNFISKDLPFFSTMQNNFFISDVHENKGIQCRFGMRGIISEAHYDTGRNMVAMLRGEKRYILIPPNACRNLSIISDISHPSFRHSWKDWSSMKTIQSSQFDHVKAIETIVRKGEILYIPSYWFHYIISLDYSIQCNSRSGRAPDIHLSEDLLKCLGQYNRFVSF